jgi:plasmid stabilization system protein ParE
VAYQIFYSEDALVDLEIILEYIRADNPRAAERLGTALLAHVDLLRHFPRLGTSIPRRRGVRKIFHTPVVVYYRLYDDKNTIEILHFWHGSRRDPVL